MRDVCCLCPLYNASMFIFSVNPVLNIKAELASLMSPTTWARAYIETYIYIQTVNRFARFPSVFHFPNPCICIIAWNTLTFLSFVFLTLKLAVGSQFRTTLAVEWPWSKSMISYPTVCRYHAVYVYSFLLYLYHHFPCSSYRITVAQIDTGAPIKGQFLCRVYVS